MKTQLCIKWFICEEGFGHVVRSCGLIGDFLERYKSDNLIIEIYCGDKKKQILTRLSQYIHRICVYEVNSNIKLMKKSGLYLDHQESLEQLIIWNDLIPTWFSSVLKLSDSKLRCILVVSDSVPQARLLAYYCSCKCIGISHFTWDWMYQALINDISPETSSDVLKSYNACLEKMYDYYDLFDQSIFPPLTPIGNLEIYSKRRRRHSFCNYILSNAFVESYCNISDSHQETQLPEKTLLVMNNGTSSLSSLIDKLIISWPSDTDIKMVVGPSPLSDRAIRSIKYSKNITQLENISETHNFIGRADFILARCGFNTLSEMIHTSAHGFLVNEVNNPEITSNLSYAAELGLEIINAENLTADILYDSIYRKDKSNCLLGNRKTYSRKDLLVGRTQCINILSGESSKESI